MTDSNYLGIDWGKYTNASSPAEQQALLSQYQSTYNNTPEFGANQNVPGFAESSPDYTPPSLSMYGADDAQPPGMDWGTLQGWGQLLGGVGDIGKAYMSYKNYGLAKDQFDFSKQYANRNLENQTKTVQHQLNNQYAAQTRGAPARTPQLNTAPIV